MAVAVTPRTKRSWSPRLKQLPESECPGLVPAATSCRELVLRCGACLAGTWTESRSVGGRDTARAVPAMRWGQPGLGHNLEGAADPAPRPGRGSQNPRMCQKAGAPGRRWAGARSAAHPAHVKERGEGDRGAQSSLFGSARWARMFCSLLGVTPRPPASCYVLLTWPADC